MPGTKIGRKQGQEFFPRELRPMVLDDLGLIPALYSFMKVDTHSELISRSQRDRLDPQNVAAANNQRRRTYHHWQNRIRARLFRVETGDIVAELANGAGRHSDIIDYHMRSRI